MRPMLFVLPFLLGCAGIARQLAPSMGLIGPGAGVSDELATTACGSKDAFDARVAEAKAHLKAGGSIMPNVGDTMCDVLALIGLPSEQTRVASEYGESAHWYYREARPGGSDAVHLVVLAPGPNRRGVVESVVW